MKRALLEWGAIAAGILAAILTAVWLASYFIEPWHYQFSPAREFLVIAHDGYISFFNDTDIDHKTGKRVIRKIDEVEDLVTIHIAWPVPGFQLFYCRRADGSTCWSFELTLLLPILLLVITVIALVRRNRRSAGSAEKTGTPIRWRMNLSLAVLKGIGIACLVVCAILLFVAWERFRMPFELRKDPLRTSDLVRVWVTWSANRGGAFLALRKNLLVGIAGLLVVALILVDFVLSRDPGGNLIGYWLWLSSAALLGASGFFLWLRDRARAGRPAQGAASMSQMARKFLIACRRSRSTADRASIMSQMVKTFLIAWVVFGAPMSVFFTFLYGPRVGVPSGLGFGFLFAALTSAFAMYQASFKGQCPLAEGETLRKEGLANHSVRAVGVGGFLYLTSSRLYFRSHKINLQNYELSIPLKDVLSTKTTWTAGIIPTGLCIETPTGTTRFVVPGSRSWAKAINEAKSGQASRGNPPG